MRCLNCGWDNIEGSKVCLKCGQPLLNTYTTSDNPFTTSRTPVPADKDDIEPRPTVLNNAFQNTECRKTVILHPKEQKEEILSSPTICQQCGYPIVTGDSVCPNCGASQIVEEKESKLGNITANKDLDSQNSLCESCGHQVGIHDLFCPNCGKPIRRKTIKLPIRQIAEIKKELEPKCSLTLIPEIHEQKETATEKYQGSNIILNRDNTEQDNRTITSKVQATLTFEDGKWYITNGSEQETTYIQVTHKFQISSGDIIILGDRKFQFNKEE